MAALEAVANRARCSAILEVSIGILMVLVAQLTQGSAGGPRTRWPTADRLLFLQTQGKRSDRSPPIGSNCTEEKHVGLTGSASVGG